MVDTDAVVLVYNPDAPAQDKQLTDWFDFFVKKNGLRDEQCLIFANRPNPTSDRIRPRKIAPECVVSGRTIINELLFVI